MELRHGPWDRVLYDAEPDLLLVDPPYSEVTHAGHAAGVEIARGAGRDRGAISYDFWRPEDVFSFVEHWSPRTRGWFVAFADDELIGAWKAALAACDRLVFPTLPCVEVGANCRYQGDGPSSWATFVIVARPRSRAAAKWGTLSGAVLKPEGARGSRKLIRGEKPLWAMEQLVREYSRRGDLVVDPCAGRGTSLLAAHRLGRRGLGAEQDPATYALAMERLST